VFTGLVQAVGTVAWRSESQLEILPPPSFAPDGYAEGEWISVNGVGLPGIESASGIGFGISEETWRRSALGVLRPGQAVNLERAMSATDRFGGHMVQGHVDSIGTLVAIDGDRFDWQVDPEFDRYLIDKGSITLDGISLTVVLPVAGRFQTWIIPTTRTHTNLNQLTVGDTVNVEFDVIAKYVERLLAPRLG